MLRACLPLISMETVIHQALCGTLGDNQGDPPPVVAKSAHPRSFLSDTRACGAFLSSLFTFDREFVQSVKPPAQTARGATCPSGEGGHGQATGSSTGPADGMNGGWVVCALVHQRSGTQASLVATAMDRWKLLELPLWVFELRGMIRR